MTTREQVIPPPNRTKLCTYVSFRASKGIVQKSAYPIVTCDWFWWAGRWYSCRGSQISLSIYSSKQSRYFYLVVQVTTQAAASMSEWASLLLHQSQDSAPWLLLHMHASETRTKHQWLKEGTTRQTLLHCCFEVDENQNKEQLYKD